jgi:hypothetical protein
MRRCNPGDMIELQIIRDGMMVPVSIPCPLK